MKSQSVTVRDLKSRLSDYLNKVKRGEIITITDHGKPISRIIPVGKALPVSVLVDFGLAEWNKKPLEPQKPVVKNKSNQRVSDILLDMRV